MLHPPPHGPTLAKKCTAPTATGDELSGRGCVVFCGSGKSPGRSAFRQSPGRDRFRQSPGRSCPTIGIKSPAMVRTIARCQPARLRRALLPGQSADHRYQRSIPLRVIRFPFAISPASPFPRRTENNEWFGPGMKTHRGVFTPRPNHPPFLPPGQTTRGCAARAKPGRKTGDPRARCRPSRGAPRRPGFRAAPRRIGLRRRAWPGRTRPGAVHFAASGTSPAATASRRVAVEWGGSGVATCNSTNSPAYSGTFSPRTPEDISTEKKR